jgi:hypothetical protein
MFRQQIGHGQVGERVFAVKGSHRHFAVDSRNRAISDGPGRTHEQSLACKRTFPNEIPILQYADDCFLATLRDDTELRPTALKIEDCISGISLRKDSLALPKQHKSPALAYRGQTFWASKSYCFLAGTAAHILSHLRAATLSLKSFTTARSKRFILAHFYRKC